MTHPAKRILHRPKGGWGRTRGEKLLPLLFLLFILSSWVSIQSLIWSFNTILESLL